STLGDLGINERPLRHAMWFSGLTVSEITTVMGTPPEPIAIESDPAGSTSLSHLLHSDQTSWLPDNLLERGDRMTMAASLEARMPFLDHRLVGFASKLPDSMRIRGLTGKWLLRESMRD